MCDFSVLNHFQVGIANVIELIFLDNDFVIALRTMDGYLLRRLANRVVGYDFFEIE